jgi:hypothetical protein
MKLSLLNRNGRLMATLATVLFAPALTGAATVIDHVPYTITAPGVYELQGDLTANDTNGIDVKADHVLIDMKGYALTQSQTGSSSGVTSASTDVTVRNGTIYGFGDGVSLFGAENSVIAVRFLHNNITADIKGNDDAIKDCYVVGGGRTDGIGIEIESGSGVQVKGNQVCDCRIAIVSTSVSGSGFIQNYVANSDKGLQLNDHDYYQGNVVTNCADGIEGGHAIGTENGGD